MRKAKYVFSIAIVLMMLAFFVPKTADAKDEKQLAEELAKQFKFYELAEEILIKELNRTDFSEKNEENQYKYECAVSLSNVYKWHAAQLEFQGEKDKGAELREKADSVVREWTEKRFGDDDFGQVQIARQVLNDGENMIKKAEQEDEPEKREEFYARALEYINRAKEIFERIAKEYLENLDEIVMNYEDDPENKENQEKYTVLSVSWFNWAKSMFLLGKMGIDTKKNYASAIKEINDIAFEISGTAISYFSLILYGDILFEQENYNKATGIFKSVYSSLPVTDSRWGESDQVQVDRIRQESYYKAANALMQAKKYEDAVKILKNMIDIDYPKQSQDWYVKLGRLLLAEAKIKMGAEPAEVIKEESFVSFSKDPQDFFRAKYYDVLASIGRYPDLDLQTRILCARAAYDQNRFVDAIPIYQLALNQLKDDTEFERYAPEIYFRIGDSFQKSWRFAEAAIALIEGSQKLVYLSFKYKGEKEVPVHMQDNFGLKQKYLFMDDKGDYQVELVQKIAVTMAEKAQQNAKWVPEATTNGTIAYKFARDIERRRSNIEGIVGGSEKSLQINFQTEVYDKRYIPAWKSYTSNEKNANFFSTIAGFSALTRIVGPSQYLKGLVNSADLMKIHYSLLNQDKVKYQNAFPEKVDWENSETFVNGSRNYQGIGFYKWEKSRIGQDNLLDISDNMRAYIEGYLDKILDPATADDLKLMYYYKTVYFFTKVLFETILIDKPAFEATEVGIFDKDLKTLVDAFGKYAKRQYMKKIGMPDEGPEIKVASVFDEMTPSEMQTVMKDYATAIIDLGYVMIDNPWSDKGHIVNRINDAQELLNKSDKQYQENVKKLADSKEKAYQIEEEVLYFWNDFDANYGIYYMDKTDEKKNKELVDRYKVLAYRFFFSEFVYHLNHDYIFEAEKDFEAYKQVLAEEITDTDSKEYDKMISMINYLSNKFGVYNTKQFGRYIDSYSLLGQIRADLISSKFMTMEDLVKSINYSTIDDRTEMKGDVETTVNDKENLLATLTDPDSGEYRLVENTTFQDYMLDLMKNLISWATKGEKDKILEYCKKFNFDLDAALKIYFTVVEKIDIEGKDLMDEFMKELVEYGKNKKENKSHPVATKIYDNYLIKVYLNRQYIADEIFKVMNIYREKYNAVGSRAAKYDYLAYKLTKKSKEDLNKLRLIGSKLYTADLYPEAIDMLQKLMTILEQNEEKYQIFKDGKPAPISREDSLKYEIYIRSMLADCYLKLAQKDITYSPDGEYWKLAEFNLTRMFDFIRYRFEQRQIGKNERIGWEKHLDQYYYMNMENYHELLVAKAQYILNNGGTYKMDTDIRSLSVRKENIDGKLVEVASGDKIEELNAKDAAYTTLNRVAWVCHYLSNQSPDFSPNERHYKYIEYFKADIMVAQIANEEQYNKKLLEAKETYMTMLGDHDLETFVFFGDPEFSIEFKKVIRQIEEMIKIRKLEK